MVSLRIRDRQVSNNLDKILTLVSTQSLQKAGKTDTEEIQCQQQQQQNMMNMMNMINIISIISSMLNHGAPEKTQALNPFRQ